MTSVEWFTLRGTLSFSAGADVLATGCSTRKDLIDRTPNLIASEALFFASPCFLQRDVAESPL